MVFQKMLASNFVEIYYSIFQTKIAEDIWLLEDYITAKLRLYSASIWWDTGSSPFGKEIGRVVDLLELVEFSTMENTPSLLIDQRMYLDNFAKTG